jgi:hypothetical protein
MSVGVKVGYCFGVGLIIVIARVDIFWKLSNLYLFALCSKLRIKFPLLFDRTSWLCNA